MPHADRIRDMNKGLPLVGRELHFPRYARALCCETNTLHERGDQRCPRESWGSAFMLLSVALGSAVYPGRPVAAAQPERRVVFCEGFEGHGKMTSWASNGPYKVNFAGPTEGRAATGKRSFKIDVTWTDCSYNYWWSTPLMIPYTGQPVVRGKLYVERGGAVLGHAYAMPVGPTSGGVAHGEAVQRRPDGWTLWQCGPSPGATPDVARAWAENVTGIVPRKSVPTLEADDTIYLQAVAVYLKPDKQRRTVVYVDDLDVEAALPEGYRERLKGRVAQIAAERRALVREAAAAMREKLAKLASQMRAVPTLSLPGASPALRNCGQRMRRQCNEMRSRLEATLQQLQAAPKADVLSSARCSLALLRKASACCQAFASYAADHPQLPYVVWIVDPISNEKVLPDTFPAPGILGTRLSL